MATAELKTRKQERSVSKFGLPTVEIGCVSLLAFVFSVLPPDATEPNGLIVLAYVGAVLLAAGRLLLGVGLVRVRETGVTR